MKFSSTGKDSDKKVTVMLMVMLKLISLFLGLSISSNIYLSDFIKTWALGFCLQSGVQEIRGLP